MNSNSKKLIAAVAALQILLYHCWMPVFGYGTFFGSIERFLIASTYYGVDVFFFISAYSLVSRPVDDYLRFIGNRALKLLPLFFIALLTGRFLWFIPAIMVMYLALPPLHRLCRKMPVVSLLILIVSWAGAVYLILGLIRPASDVGIFLFRIPSMILGAYSVGVIEKMTSRQALLWGAALLAVGTAAVYGFGYMNRLNVPFRGTFYLTGIPVMLGTVLLLNLLGSKRIPRFIERFGGMTLELYFLQMMFGTFLVGVLFRLTGSRILTNALTLAVIICASYWLKKINDVVMKTMLPNSPAMSSR